MGVKHQGLKIDKRTVKKFQFICSYYGESASKINERLLHEYLKTADCSQPPAGEKVNYTVYLSDEDLQKMRNAARNESRTASELVEHLLKHFICDFEQTQGAISDDDLSYNEQEKK